MSSTNYAKSSDNYLAHRHFRKNIYAGILKDIDNAVNIYEIYIDLFDHFAISKKFVGEMLEDYVKAGRLTYEDEKNTIVSITDKGLADIDQMQRALRK